MGYKFPYLPGTAVKLAGLLTWNLDVTDSSMENRRLGRNISQFVPATPDKTLGRDCFLPNADHSLLILSLLKSGRQLKNDTLDLQYNYLYVEMYSTNSAVRILTRLRAGRSGGRVSAVARDFTQRPSDGFRCYPNLILRGPCGYSDLGREVDH